MLHLVQELASVVVHEGLLSIGHLVGREEALTNLEKNFFLWGGEQDGEMLEDWMIINGEVHTAMVHISPYDLSMGSQEKIPTNLGTLDVLEDGELGRGLVLAKPKFLLKRYHLSGSLGGQAYLDAEEFIQLQLD